VDTISMEWRMTLVTARRSAVSAFFALFAIPFLTLAPALPHELRKDGDPSNDWIEGLKNSSGHACCGNNDCRPAASGSLTSRPGGSLQVEVGGSRFAVPEASIVRETSPDGRTWVCPDLRPVLGGYAYSVIGIRCLVLPPTM
jgi:hypothetical protein